MEGRQFNRQFKAIKIGKLYVSNKGMWSFYDHEKEYNIIDREYEGIIDTFIKEAKDENSLLIYRVKKQIRDKRGRILRVVEPVGIVDE